jgi:hypothetical protein
MNYAKAHELTPNIPAVLKSDGYLHTVTASHYETAGQFDVAGTLYVWIGCSTMIVDSVRADENHWAAIKRVVATWKREQCEADHAIALGMADGVDLSTYAPWFAALVSKREDCTDTDAFERDAYSGHLSYEIGGTDGHYGPEARDRWLHWFRQDPIRSLYNGNDKRHTLAPMVLSYMATIR